MPEQQPVKINTKRAIRIVIAALCLASTGAGAVHRHAHPARSVHAAPPAAVGIPDADGRLFGHLPYDEAPPSDLEIVMPGFGLGVPCRMQHDAAADLTHLLNGANATPGIAGKLRGVSCYRTAAHQRAVFCHVGRAGNACRDAALRAHSVGPPGFSEHSTGYAIDFGVRPAPGCRDVDPCIAETEAGKWLLAHAPDYGFELSFPQDNAQGVTWEPWHWRWVGTSIDKPGAARARMVFARARAEFPASPMIDGAPVRAAHSVPAGPPNIVLLPGVY
jgi:D-alanyl-D-alanine carboxypeptidase